MNIKDIFGKLKAEDVPIMEIPEQDVLQNFMKSTENDVTFAEICRATGIKNERILEINQEISLHFKNNLAPKVLFKAMLSASNKDNEEFEQYFQRADVDLCCHFMFKVTDIKKNMRNLNTPQFVFLYENWKKYRGY